MRHVILWVLAAWLFMGAAATARAAFIGHDGDKKDEKKKEEEKKPKGNPSWGVPAGAADAKDIKKIDTSKQQYFIIMLRDGDGSVRLEPLMKRFERDYAKALAEQYRMQLAGWQRSATEWQADPMNRGKKYEMPKPQPTVVVRKLGPFSYEEATEALPKLQVKLEEEKAEAERKAAEKEAAAQARREAAEQAKAEREEKLKAAREANEEKAEEEKTGEEQPAAAE